ncbi:DMT family transporter [Pseudonocardia sp.]|uniref:DMT family transporter n=1 Tax=Pseudonocardia sp. TaxID=60912 RepID=UPI003D0B0EE1
MKTVAVTVLAPIAWGTTYVLVTEVLPPGRPVFDAAARVLPAGLLLVAVAWLLRGWRPGRADGRRVAVLGLVNVGLFFPLLILAATLLPGGVAAAAGGLQPLLVVGFAGLLARRRPPGREIAVGIAAAVGVGLVVLRPGAGYDPVGLLAALAANVSFAAGVVLTRRFPRPADPIGDVGGQLLAGAVLIVPLALLVEGPPPALDGGQALGVAYFSLVATAAAFVVWFEGVRRLPVVAPPLLGLAAPLTGAVLGWVLLGEDLTATQLAGFALTFAAIAYGALASRAPRADTLPRADPPCQASPHDARPARARRPRHGGRDRVHLAAARGDPADRALRARQGAA